MARPRPRPLWSNAHRSLRFLVQDVTLTKRGAIVTLAVRWQTQPAPGSRCHGRCARYEARTSHPGRLVVLQRPK